MLKTDVPLWIIREDRNDGIRLSKHKAYFGSARGTTVSRECGFREQEAEPAEQIIRYPGDKPCIHMNKKENRDGSREPSRK